MKLHELTGNKILAIKGYPPHKKKDKYIEPVFFLFNDGETILELTEQDCYTYHDCAQSARFLNVYQDKEKWERFNGFPDANASL